MQLPPTTRYFLRFFGSASWLSNGTFYKMSLLEDTVHRTVDQRLHEDVQGFVLASRRLTFGFLDAFVRLLIFFPQLVMHAPPGVWELCLALAFGSSVFTHLIGKVGGFNRLWF